MASLCETALWNSTVRNSPITLITLVVELGRRQLVTIESESLIVSSKISRKALS